jgi:DNA-binding transcriptional MerR regulator
MMKFSAMLDGPFVGTAEELAAYVSGKLASFGFGPRFQANERLVRFYAFEGLIDKPERAEDDKRRANFGDKQVRQLLVARILSERGNDLETIRGMLRRHATLPQLDELIDEHARASELESRSSRPHLAGSLQEPAVAYSRREVRSRGVDSEAARLPSQGIPRPGRFSSETLHQLRDISDARSPGLIFRKMVMRESQREDLSPEVRGLYRQLLAFHPSDPGEAPKRERWSKIRLAPWCEVLIHIDGRAKPSREEINEMVDNLRNSLEDSYM